MIAFGLAWWLLAILVTFALSLTFVVLVFIFDGHLIADDETSEVLDKMDIEQRVREGRHP